MRRRTAEQASRGQLVDDAVFAVRFAGWLVDDPDRAQRALAALTPAERRFVEDLEAGRITEHGCLIELIERRFGPYQPRAGW